MYCVSVERFGIALHRQRQIRRDDAFGVVADVDVHHALKAANQQAAADQQDERRRDLRGDEDVPRADVRRPAELARPPSFSDVGGVAAREHEARAPGRTRCW